MISTNKCKLCQKSFKSGRCFVKHLGSAKHIKIQRNKKNLDALLSTNRQCYILAKGYLQDKSVDLKTADILNYFYTLGMVNALPYPDKCYVQFKTKEIAKSIHAKKHVVKNIDIAVTRLGGNKCEKKNVQEASSQLYNSLSQDLCSRMHTVMNLDEIEACLINILQEIELKPKEQTERQLLMTQIHTYLQEYYPGCEVFAFGSSVNGLGLSGCDLDLCTDVGLLTGEAYDIDSAEKLNSKFAKIIGMTKIATDIKDHLLPKGRLPIISFTDVATSIDVNLSSTNALPHFNTHLIRSYADSSTVVKEYLIILKYWAKLRGITLSRKPVYGITNYAFTMMCLFYLMVRNDPVIPSVCLLQKDYHNRKYSPIIVDGWDCSFVTNMEPLLKKPVTAMQLVREFFAYYSTLDTTTYAVSPYAGGLVPVDGLRLEAERRPLLVRDKFPVYFGQGRAFRSGTLNVQDPFVHSTNLTRVLRPNRCRNFQKCCKNAAIACNLITRKECPIWALFDHRYVKCENMIELNKQRPEYKFTFNFRKAKIISEDLQISRAQSDDSMSRSAAFVIRTVLDQCLMVKRHDRPCSQCTTTHCVLNSTCTVSLDLTRNRKRLRARTKENDKDPFARETETSRKVLLVSEPQSLALSEPVSFVVHVCKSSQKRHSSQPHPQFEVSCVYDRKCESGLAFFKLFQQLFNFIKCKLRQHVV